nr:GNAT family N-acetyltransferase [Anseongella ginsenosidimutans]
MMKVLVNKVSSAEELELVFSIRQKVFVEEQQVSPEEEYDEFEAVSVHFLAKLNGTPAGTARWRKTGQGYKLERFAVLKEFRGSGLGSALMKALLSDLPADASSVYLNAQLDARKLYEKFGFRQEGEEFLEAGIRHYRMRLIPVY